MNPDDLPRAPYGFNHSAPPLNLKEAVKRLNKLIQEVSDLDKAKGAVETLYRAGTIGSRAAEDMRTTIDRQTKFMRAKLEAILSA